jgi:hypothetical protein
MQSRGARQGTESDECPLRTREHTVAGYRYDQLHRDGKRLVRDWIKRGLRGSTESRGDFEAFIYLWIGFNAWAACVTDKDKDSMMVNALAKDHALNDAFIRLGDEPAFLESANRFAGLWPIFRAQEISRRGLNRWPELSETRQDVIQSYLAGGAFQFAPRCFTLHASRSEQIPRDWAHTVTTAYTVRCNLFHGGKTLSSESDVEIVDATHAVSFAVCGTGAAATA